MSCERKKQTGEPMVDAAETQNEPRQARNFRIVVAVATVCLLVIIVSLCIGVVILFAKREGGVIQFTMQLDSTAQQEVRSDPNSNIILHHVQESDLEAWIVDDFNTFITVTKVRTQSGTICYAAPMNKSKDVDLSQIDQLQTLPDSAAIQRVSYKASATPIRDVSFLSDSAKELCQSTPVYWLYTDCSGPGQLPADSNVKTVDRAKRSTYCYPWTCNDHTSWNYTLSITDFTRYCQSNGYPTYYYWCGCCWCYASCCQFTTFRYWDACESKYLCFFVSSANCDVYYWNYNYCCCYNTLYISTSTVTTSSTDTPSTDTPSTDTPSTDTPSTISTSSIDIPSTANP